MNPKTSSRSFNMIIAGVGGQGVVTLTQVITSLCEKNNILVQSSIHKGGAQQLGSVHSVLRLFLKPDPDAQNYSTQLLDGDLDLMLSLEPWETLRYSRFFSKNTIVLSNAREIGIETERFQAKKFVDPCVLLRELDLKLTLVDFSREAEERFGNKKMLNFVVAERAVIDKLIPFSKDDLIAAFQSRGLSVLQNVVLKHGGEQNV